METMTGRQRVMAALNRQPTDRLPWAPLIDDYFISSLRDGGRKDAEILAVMREAGVDIIERHVPCCEEIMDDVTVRHWEDDAHTERFQSYETPVGSLRCSWRFMGQSWVMHEHLIKDVGDIAVMRFVAEHTRYAPQYEQFAQRDAQIGEDGIATASGNMSPIQELLQFHCGVENLVYMLMDYPDEMKALMATMQERNLRQYAVLAASPAQVVIDYEDTSSTVMSRDMFTEHSLPAINAYADVIHGAGKRFITHMCGSLRSFVHQIAQGRQWGVDSVCPPETGDLCAWDARAAWGDKVIIGGICPPDLVLRGVEENLRTVCTIIQRMPDMRGYVLSTGDATPYGTPLATLRAITRLVEVLGEASLTGAFDADAVVARVMGEMA